MLQLMLLGYHNIKKTIVTLKSGRSLNKTYCIYEIYMREITNVLLNELHTQKSTTMSVLEHASLHPQNHTHITQSFTHATTFNYT